MPLPLTIFIFRIRLTSAISSCLRGRSRNLSQVVVGKKCQTQIVRGEELVSFFAANMHDYAGAIEYGKKTKRIPHYDPDSAQQQRIHFDESDVPDLPELNDNEGEFKGDADDGLIDGVRPFDVEP